MCWSQFSSSDVNGDGKIQREEFIVYLKTVRALPAPLSAFHVLHSKSVLYGAFCMGAQTMGLRPGQYQGQRYVRAEEKALEDRADGTTVEARRRPAAVAQGGRETQRGWSQSDRERERMYAKRASHSPRPRPNRSGG